MCEIITTADGERVPLTVDRVWSSQEGARLHNAISDVLEAGGVYAPLSKRIEITREVIGQLLEERQALLSGG